MRHVFLLSPAYCGGKRAAMLLREDSGFELARRLRQGDLAIGEAFSFLSGLYFRGKLAYASTFGCPEDPAYVITPTRGLVAPSTPVTSAVLREFADVDVSETEPRYRTALARDAALLASRLPASSRVVLLGSVATGKYVDVLSPALGELLHYPVAFIGRGDMSRGGLLLRSARAETELDYMPIASGARVRGPRPAKLPRIPTRFLRLSEAK